MENKNPLDGITVGGVAVEEHLKQQSDTDSVDMYQEDIVSKKRILPARVNLRYKPKKEKHGKVRMISPTEDFNKKISNNYAGCKTIKHLLIAIFLSGQKLTARQLLGEIIEHRKGTEPYFSESMEKEGPLKIRKVWSLMTNISKSQLGHIALSSRIETKEENPTSYKRAKIYWFNKEGRELSLKEAYALSAPKKKSKKKPDESKPKVPESFDKVLAELLDKMVDKDSFEPIITSLQTQFQSLTKRVAQLEMEPVSTSNDNLIDGFKNPVSDMLEPTNKINISGGITVNLYTFKEDK